MKLMTFLMLAVMKSQVADYLHLPSAKDPLPWSFEQVSPHVYSFATHFDRGLVVATDEGLVVVDPFNDATASRLAAQLRESFPGKPVRTLIYTHYHLDHVRGGTALSPAEILADEKAPQYWKDFDAKGIAEPTRLLSGSTSMTLGGVQIELMKLPKGHTDTNYAVFVPGDKALFVSDMAFVKAFPPYGMPDVYRPGQIAGLKQLAALDFDHFVPSHFGVGKKQDLVDNVTFYESTQKLARQLVSEKQQFLASREALDEALDGMMEQLEKDYGDWHGFKGQGLQLTLRNFIGEGLGY